MKLIKESLNEVISFERGGDPISKLGIGKKQLIKDWLKEYNIKNYKINDDLSIDVNGDLDLANLNLIKFPDYIQFNKISGFFNCCHNYLISLRGCPKYVGSWFGCAENQLSSLEGCPEYVDYDFYCYENKIKFKSKDICKICEVGGSIAV